MFSQVFPIRNEGGVPEIGEQDVMVVDQNPGMKDRIDSIDEVVRLLFRVR